MKKPCPYLKISLKGWLGESSYDPKSFLTQLENEIHPCHLTVDWESENLDKAKACIGGLQFMNNSCKLFKDVTTAKLQKEAGKNDDVISFAHNFIKHHEKV